MACVIVTRLQLRLTYLTNKELTLQPTKCQVRYEGLNLKPENAIMCCLVTATNNLRMTDEDIVERPLYRVSWRIYYALRYVLWRY
jgi:hypothetical protein